MDLKGIIKEQRQELERIEQEESLVKRDGLDGAKKFLDFPNVVAILGIHRCGKSIFSFMLAKGMRMGYVNFDDERLSELETGDLDGVLGAFYELYGDVDCVILDEIQNIRKWELFVNRLRRTKRVILTGSNSNLLTGELSTHLTGRHVDVRLFPFSFREFLAKKSFKESKAYTTKERAELLNLLRDYLQVGGFPESYKFGRVMVSGLYEDILTKDILLRYRISKVDELKRLAKYLVSNASQEITYSSLSRLLGVKHVSTISNWVGYLEEAFLVFRLERFDFSLKKQFIAPKKVYCIDTGLVNSIGFGFSENIGRIMENAVAIELQRRKYQENAIEVYYWKDARQNEVDFIIKKEKIITQLIQVSYANGKDEIRGREISSLVKASVALRCDNLAVITWNYESEEKTDGKKIHFVPLWKWLLGH
ncbi:MAG: ATP-binding protein [Candidatus Micrarchaeia archaeon]